MNKINKTCETRIYDHMLALVPGIGDITIAALLDVFKTASGVFKAGESELERVPGLSKKKIEALISTGKDKEKIRRQTDNWEKTGIRTVFITDDDYPSVLKHLYDAPYALYYMGKLPVASAPAVAIVGARGCTDYGKNVAYSFGKQLAREGIQIISGMAAGADIYGHKGAIGSGGYTAGILGCGVDICYPRINISTYFEMKENGCIMSEVPPGTRPAPGLFPRRNRLIAALSDAVIVIEARERSGSLITADQALEQGKDVFAVPGRIGDPLSEGCISLIKQGAIPLTSVKDILECDSIKRKTADNNIPSELSSEQKDCDPSSCRENDLNYKVYEVLTDMPKNINRIMYETRLGYEITAQALLELELEGLLRCVSAGLYVRSAL